MANRPRWLDDFSTDPTLDPAYTINTGSTGWNYNASTDQLEQTSSGFVVGAAATLLDSKHQSGIVEADVQYFHSASGVESCLAIRAFGYWFIVGQGTSGSFKFIGIGSENETLADLTASYSTKLLQYKAKTQIGAFTMRIVGTPIGVDFYIDDQIEFTIPSKVTTGNISVQVYRNAGNSGGTNFVSRLLIKADASLPLTPTVITPSLAGALPATTGPVIVQVPESRLYLDLGAYAGRIGTGGLTNVFYDPGGANVAMAEDTGVPDGLGGTNGDYYLESPVRGVSSDDRLVIKEAFVTANTVVPTDDIDFDIVGGPTGQNALVKQEDDLHCYIEKYSNPTTSQDPNKGFINNLLHIVLHNNNADGNDSFLTAGSRPEWIDNGYGNNLAFSSSAVLPFIFDFDLLHVRKITEIAWFNQFGGKFPLSVDVYSNTIPFVGASLAQGTLEANNFYGHNSSLPTGIISDDYRIFGNSVPTVPINAITRYLRLVFNADNFAGSGTYTFGQSAFFFETEKLGSINSFDDNAQFEHDPGSGYVAFPVGGVTQNDGMVRITLPSSIDHDGNSPNYYKVYFKPDITD